MNIAYIVSAAHLHERTGSLPPMIDEADCDGALIEVAQSRATDGETLQQVVNDLDRRGDIVVRALLCLKASCALRDRRPPRLSEQDRLDPNAKRRSS
jgi:hypothetical protein